MYLIHIFSLSFSHTKTWDENEESGEKMMLFMNGEFYNYQHEVKHVHPFTYLTSLYGELYLPWGFSFKVSLSKCGSGENYHWKSLKSPVMYSLLGFLYIILFFSNHSQFFSVLWHGTVSTAKLQWNDAVPKHNVGICKVCSLEFMPWKEAYGTSACGVPCSRLGVMKDDLVWALQAGNQTGEE